MRGDQVVAFVHCPLLPRASRAKAAPLVCGRPVSREGSPLKKGSAWGSMQVKGARWRWKVKLGIVDRLENVAAR